MKCHGVCIGERFTTQTHDITYPKVVSLKENNPSGDNLLEPCVSFF